MDAPNLVRIPIESIERVEVIDGPSRCSTATARSPASSSSPPIRATASEDEHHGAGRVRTAPSGERPDEGRVGG